MNDAPSLAKQFLAYDNLAHVDNALARALCYWPEYCSLLKALRSDATAQAKIRRWVAELDVEECRSPAASAIAGDEDAEEHGYVRWRIVLAILLAAACETVGAAGQPSKVQMALAGFFEEQANSDPSRFGFYYRFAAAFQAWIAVQRTAAFEHWNATADVCRDCRGPGKVDNVLRSIIELLYDDVQKTRSTFRAVFGICAKDIALSAIRNGERRRIQRAAEVTLESPRLEVRNSWQPYADDAHEIERRLWGELAWIMWEVDDLAFVRRNIADHERTVHEHVTSSLSHDGAGDDEDTPEHLEQKNKRRKAWEALFDNVIYPYLRPFQFTLFVRAATSQNDEAETEVRFETHRTLGQLDIELPEGASREEHWREEGRSERAIARLNDVVGALYEKGFPKSFFRRLQEVRLSSATPERTFPFILFPDGEISFYYALEIAERRQLRKQALAIRGIEEVRSDAETIDAIKGSTSARDLIWEKRKFPYGLFPDTKKFPLHHRCAALVSAAQMIVEDPHEEWPAEKSSANLIVQEFCHTKSPQDYLQTILDHKEFQVEGGKRSPARIEWEPEVMLRRDDPQCHTLFFLPIGRDILDIPTAMIAGTLHGVEMRWMPFSSKRMVSYLMPLAYILRPLLDRMVHGVFVEQALKAARAEKDRQFRTKLELAVEDLFTQIQQVARSAAQIQAEVTPAPVLFFSAKALLLDKLFAPNEITIIPASVLEHMDLTPEEAGRLEGESPEYRYVASHDMIGESEILTPETAQATARALTVAAASAMQSEWMCKSFFGPLTKEIKTPRDADDAFALLKRFLHRYHSLEEHELLIGDLLVVVRLSAIDVKRRFDGTLSAKYNGKQLRPNDEWLRLCRSAKQKVVFGSPRGSRAAPPTNAAFLTAFARLLTEEMKSIGGHGNLDGALNAVEIKTDLGESPTMEMVLSGHRHLRDLNKLKGSQTDDEPRQRGLRSVLATFAAAVGHEPSWFNTNNPATLNDVTDPFAICQSTVDYPGLREPLRTFAMRLRFPLAAAEGASDARPRG